MSEDTFSVPAHGQRHDVGGADPVTGIAPGAHGSTHQFGSSDPIEATDFALLDGTNDSSGFATLTSGIHVPDSGVLELFAIANDDETGNVVIDIASGASGKGAVPGDVAIGADSTVIRFTAGANNAIGFFAKSAAGQGITPPVLATGIGKTADDIITVLQNYGLVTQT